MIPEKLKEVLKYEGVVSIVSKGASDAHVVNTWNSYLKVADDGRLLGPVGGMNKTEANIQENNEVLMTLGSREVQGFHSKGTGFFIKGSAVFIYEGAKFDEIKQSFPWARAVIEITTQSITQTL